MSLEITLVSNHVSVVACSKFVYDLPASLEADSVAVLLRPVGTFNPGLYLQNSNGSWNFVLDLCHFLFPGDSAAVYVYVNSKGDEFPAGYTIFQNGQLIEDAPATVGTDIDVWCAVGAGSGSGSGGGGSSNTVVVKALDSTVKVTSATVGDVTTYKVGVDTKNLSATDLKLALKPVLSVVNDAFGVPVAQNITL